MQQLISILPSKHTGVRVAAAETTWKQETSAHHVYFGQIKKRKEKGNDVNRGLSEYCQNVSCSRTGTVTGGFITHVSCGLTDSSHQCKILTYREGLGQP